MRSPRRRQRAREELPRVRKARAEVAAYASCTESQMMTMFGWTDPKMARHYTQAASKKKLAAQAAAKFGAVVNVQSLFGDEDDVAAG